MSYVFEITGDELQKAKDWIAEQDAKWVASKKLSDPLGTVLRSNRRLSHLRIYPD